MEIYLTKKNCGKFIKKTLTYNEPILVNNNSNAKSLFTIMSLSLPNIFDVKILTDDIHIHEKFNKDMEEFIYERN